MFHDVEIFEHHEQALFAALDLAMAEGLASATGRDAFADAMAVLDQLVEEKETHIYSPLAADPLTRDYISRLDGQIHGLSSRIDVLRTHIGLGLLVEHGSRADLDTSLARLVKQLRSRFRREASLLPVYAGWLDRNTNAAAAAA